MYLVGIMMGASSINRKLFFLAGVFRRLSGAQRLILLLGSLFISLWLAVFLYANYLNDGAYPLNYVNYYFYVYFGLDPPDMPFYFKQSAPSMSLFISAAFIFTLRKQILASLKKFSKIAFSLKERPAIIVRYPRFFLFVVFLIAILFRLPSLGTRYSWDSAFILYFAKSILAEYPKIPVWLDGYYFGDWFDYPPIFPFFLATVCKFTGSILSCIDTGRLSVIFLSSISVFPLYLLSKQLFGGKDVALAASFLYAIFPSEFFADEWAVSLASFLLILALYLYLKAGFENWRALVCSGVAGGLVALTHQLEFFVLGTFVFIVFCISLFRMRYLRQKSFKNFFVFLFVSLAVSGIWYVPLLMRKATYLLHFYNYRVNYNVLELNNLQRMLWLDPDTVRGALPVFLISLFGLYYLKFKRGPTLVCWLLFLAVMSFSGELGFYFINTGQHYIVHLIVIGGIIGGFGIAALARNLYHASRLKKTISSRQGGFFYLCLLLLVAALLNVFFFKAPLGGKDLLSASDTAAYYWMRENFVSSTSILSDTGHSFWVPYLAGHNAMIGNVRLSEPRKNQLQNLAATVFATGRAAQAASILQEYGVDYVYISNHTYRNFPIYGDGDIFGKKPAIIIWKNASKGMGKFEGGCFRKVYSEKGGSDTISIYKPLDCPP